MAKYTTEFYLTENGKSPVEEFLNKLNIRTRHKFFYVNNLLEEYGLKLPMPFCKNIGDDIYELRFKGQEGAIRVLYFFIKENRIIYTNGFVKKTNKTPIKEKKLAVNRKNSF